MTTRVAIRHSRFRSSRSSTAPDFAVKNADGSQQDLHPDLKADFILANPPLNMSDWSRRGGMRQDVRWKFGRPLMNDANYTWIQYSIHHLLPAGVAGFVMANNMRNAHSCSMKITDDVRKYSAEHSIAEEDALKKGLEEKSKELLEKGAEVYAKV